MRDFVDECIFAVCTAAVLVAILNCCNNAQAYELEIYDSRELPWMTEITVTNDCDYTHKLMVPIEEYDRKQNLISNWVLTVMKICSKSEADQIKQIDLTQEVN